MGVTSVIRRAFFEAGTEKVTHRSPLVACLRGDLPLRTTARHSSDVKNALKLARDFGYPLIIEDAVEAYVLAEEIAAARIPVILRTVADPHAGGRMAEGGKVALDAAARLHAAGVDLALGTWTDPGHAGPRDAASLAHRFGLPRDAALSAITRDAARILGVGDRVGSLEPGKDADLVAFDGDPLQVTSAVVFVMVDGHVEVTSVLEEPES
jgi:imidazolonepropionase-like amidohydrolase